MKSAKLLVVSAAALLTIAAGCGHHKHSGGTVVVPAPLPPVVNFTTDLARDFLAQNRVVLILQKGTIDLDEEKENLDFGEDPYMEYLFVFRSFDRQTGGKPTISRSIPQSVIDRYEDAHGLSRNGKRIGPEHVRSIADDLDVMESRAEGDYLTLAPFDQVYPQPHKFKDALAADPFLYSGLVMGSVAELVAKVRASLPQSHRDAVKIVTPGYIAWFGALGLYLPEGQSPLPPYEDAESIIILSREIFCALDDPFAAYVLTHEWGHGVDFQLLTETSGTDREAFYDVSFPWDTTLSYPTRVRTGDDFVTDYARTNKFEDWAETFAHYVCKGETFREFVKTAWQKAGATTASARANVGLFRKYWMLSVLFGGKEYGVKDTEITAALATMPKTWPHAAPEPSFSPQPFAAAAMTTHHTCCTGFPRDYR